MNQFQICNQCKAINATSLSKKIKAIDEQAQITFGCANMCGIGKTRNFVIMNHIQIVAENEEELIWKIKEQLKK